MLSKLRNKLLKIAGAIKFRQFAFKLLQMRFAKKFYQKFSLCRYYENNMLPREIVIRVTEKCFLHCEFCGQRGDKGRLDKKKLESVPIETLYKIADEVSQWAIKPFIKFTGGEPLTMWSELLDVITYMREKGIIVKLNTNGMLLKNIDVAKKLAKTDLNYLSISLDGGKEVHNRIRKNDMLFDSIMQGIDNVKKYRKDFGSHNLMILVSMVVSSETQEEIRKVYEIVVNKNIDWFNIQYLNFTTEETSKEAMGYFKKYFDVDRTPWESFNNPKFNQIDPHEIEKDIFYIINSNKNVPISVMGGIDSADQIRKYYYTTEPMHNNICSVPFTGMHVNPPGKAIFCIDYPFLEYGDLNRQSVEEIWNSEMAKNFRKDMIRYYKENKKVYPQCRRCNWLYN